MLLLVKSSSIQQNPHGQAQLRRCPERTSAETSTAPSGVYSVCYHKAADALLRDEERNATKQTVRELFMRQPSRPRGRGVRWR